MTYYIIKVVVSAAVVVAVSELAKRSSLLGGLIASLPMVSLLALCWVYGETRDPERVAALSWSIFWLVIPSLILFVALPILLKRGAGFAPALSGSLALMTAGYVLTALLARRFGVPI